MSKRAKHVGLVILAQALCLAVGLRMHHHSVVLSTRSEGIEQTLDDFDEGAERILANFNESSLVSALGDAANLENLRGLIASAGSRAASVCLVNGDWIVLFCQSAGNDISPSEPVAGNRLPWMAAAETSTIGSSRLRGTFQTLGGTHVAVARALTYGNRYLVLHTPQDAIEARTTSILSSLSGVSVLTWLWTTVLLSTCTYLVLARFHDQAEREKARSTADGLQQRQKLLRTRDAVIFGLAKLADSRDPETGEHLERISVYSTMLASVLRDHPKYASQVTPAFVRLIGISAALHDIGKVGIEDRILLKPGPLTDGERTRIQEHSAMGGECLREIEQRLGSSNFLQMAREIAFAHHERWDGKGYPRGLKGETIPLAARIVSIVDVYDALSSRRVYKWTEEARGVRGHHPSGGGNAVRSESGRRLDGPGE